MAYTVTKIPSVFGNYRVQLCNVTADAASGTIPSGFSRIDHVMHCPQSMATAAVKLAVSAGSVVISNAAAGDVFYLTIFGV